MTDFVNHPSLQVQDCGAPPRSLIDLVSMFVRFLSLQRN